VELIPFVDMHPGPLIGPGLHTCFSSVGRSLTMTSPPLCVGSPLKNIFLA